MQIALIGATGVVGTQLIKELLKKVTSPKFCY